MSNRFFDTLESKTAISNLVSKGVLLRSTSKYSIFEYYGTFADLSGIACRVEQPLFTDMPYIVSISTTYLLKHFFRWK